MISEELYGKVWRALAKSEGHKKGLPKSIGPSDAGARLASRNRRIRRLFKEGKSLPQVAALCRLTQARLKEICAEYKIERVKR